MKNHFIYGLGALLLCYGCINSQFKKSGRNAVAEVVGFVLMTLTLFKKQVAGAGSLGL